MVASGARQLDRLGAGGAAATTGAAVATEAAGGLEVGPGAGDLAGATVREWGPVLKPVGLGLLLALHSFEETTPGHPFFGWAHCTQTLLAGYLDTSQDTIARYTQLLVVCGLIRVDEVETARGKQKLYRATRGGVLPSVGLVEYLVFDADQWTRKHTGWVLGGFPAAAGETELGRVVGVLRRAYTTVRDGKGLAVITAGARLTAAGSFVARRAAATQEGLGVGGWGLVGEQGTGSGESASCGDGAGAIAGGGPQGAGMGARPVHTGSGGLGLNISAVGVGEAASGGSARGGESAGSGGEGVGESASGGGDEVGESALGGVGAGLGGVPGTNGAGESAGSGVGGDAPNVTVNRFVPFINENENENVGAGAGLDEAGLDEAGLVAWATEVLGDAHSVEWHRQLLAEVGVARYRAALAATQRAVARGRVARAGAYFTGVLRRNAGAGGWGLGVGAGEQRGGRDRGTGIRDQGLGGGADGRRESWGVGSTGAAPSPQPPTPSLQPPGPDGDLWRVWQAAVAVLRGRVPAEAVQRTLRYVVLLELDPVGGWALLGAPNVAVRDAVAREWTGAVAEALGQVRGVGVRVAVTLLPAGGGRAGAVPTLASVRTED